MTRIKLFCFPYAGGSASFYNPWKKQLGPFIEMHPFEYAGRGRRITDPLSESIDEIVNDIMQQLTPEFCNTSYALFGHSMGGAVVYELTKRISAAGLPMPGEIFISGKGAPHLPRRQTILHKLPDPQFRTNLIKLGGVSDDFFDTPELTQLFLPVIRNDLRVAEIYNVEKITPVDCNISVLVGKEEDIIEEEIDQWKHYARGNFRRYAFQGGHFFIKDHTDEITAIISRTLLQKSW
ncbi:thioesterase II family protein [Niastella sp. OAS944]|uniref:thioesterase II family protein n=1 Tax=Niastella sp. OAS944 TaxID=2664089 RepID=UPI0034704596|nr:surfactin synthase thioesterase subunit [Chitinophagaceae bacterium OAS944]